MKAIYKTATYLYVPGRQLDCGACCSKKKRHLPVPVKTGQLKRKVFFPRTGHWKLWLFWLNWRGRNVASFETWLLLEIVASYIWRQLRHMGKKIFWMEFTESDAQQWCAWNFLCSPCYICLGGLGSSYSILTLQEGWRSLREVMQCLKNAHRAGMVSLSMGGAFQCR